jgi:hypothetical protein
LPNWTLSNPDSKTCRNVMRLAERWHAIGSVGCTSSRSKLSNSRICSVKKRTAVLGDPHVRSKTSNDSGDRHSCRPALPVGLM